MTRLWVLLIGFQIYSFQTVLAQSQESEEISGLVQPPYSLIANELVSLGRCFQKDDCEYEKPLQTILGRVEVRTESSPEYMATDFYKSLNIRFFYNDEELSLYLSTQNKTVGDANRGDTVISLANTSPFHMIVAIELSPEGHLAEMDTEWHRDETLLFRKHYDQNLELVDAYFYTPPPLEEEDIEPKALEEGKIERIKVAIFDQGVDYNHPAIKTFIPRTIENGELGILGVDLINPGSLPFDLTVGDEPNHGTGVAYQVVRQDDGNESPIQIVPVRIYDQYEKAFDFCQKNNIRIISYSTEFMVNPATDSGEPIYQDANQAFERLITQVKTHPQIAFVMSSGNSRGEDLDGIPLYEKLSSLPNVFLVAASDENGKFAAEMSDYGHKTVETVEPGMHIKVAKPGGLFDFANGTSYSAPAFARKLALIMSRFPSANLSQIREALKNSVSPEEEFKDYTEWGGSADICKITQKSLFSVESSPTENAVIQP